MIKTKLLLAALAVMTVNLAAIPMVEAKTKCPDGKYWDQTARKCVSVPRGSSGW